MIDEKRKLISVSDENSKPKYSEKPILAEKISPEKIDSIQRSFGVKMTFIEKEEQRSENATESKKLKEFNEKVFSDLSPSGKKIQNLNSVKNQSEKENVFSGNQNDIQKPISKLKAPTQMNKPTTLTLGN